MPKVVDREERREEVLEATWRVMARAGLDGASIREIAAEAGHSTGVIAHYFRNKDEILRSALERVWRHEADRIAGSTKELQGLAALEAAVGEVLPVGEERLLEMAVWMCFWGRAVGDAGLAAEQRRYYGEWRALLRRYLDEAATLGEIRRGLDHGAEAMRLAAFIDGIGIQAVLEPDRAGGQRPAELVRMHLASLRPG